MSAQIVKKISNPYIVQSTDNTVPTSVTFGDPSAGNAQVTINGNLIVLGSSTQIESTNTFINDNIITLNAGLASTASPVGLISGIEVDRGAFPKVSVRWNESTQHWELTNDGSTFNAIQTTGNSVTVVQQDQNPFLGGNLHTESYTITSSNNVILSPYSSVEIDSPIQLKQLSSPPSTAIAGYNVLYGGIPSSGKTGVFVNNTSGVGQELITKSQAVIYSLIF
jgi:hypothetical protein